MGRTGSSDPFSRGNPCTSKAPAIAAPSASHSTPTARGGGYAINLGGDACTLKVKGEKHLGTYHAVVRKEGKRATRSKAERRFCLKCGSALWLWDPRWPELIHPHASAIDTPLPKPPEVVEAALDFAANWEDVPKGRGHRHFARFPSESLAEWHQRHGLEG